MKRKLLIAAFGIIMMIGGCGPKEQELVDKGNEILGEIETIILETAEKLETEEGKKQDTIVKEDKNEDKASETAEIQNTILLENIKQYESKIRGIKNSVIPDTMLMLLEEGGTILVDLKGNILCQYKWYEEACGLFERNEGGKKKIYKTIINNQGKYSNEDVTELFLSEASKYVKITADTIEPIVWVTDIVESYNSYDYILTAYDSTGKELNVWHRSDFETDCFDYGYNPNEIFQLLNISYHGEQIYCISTNNYEESFIINLDNDIVMPKGLSVFVTAFDEKIFIDGICYDKSGNILWNKEDVIEKKILRNQYEGIGIVGYLKNDVIKFINMDGNIEFEIPIKSDIYKFNGYTEDCPYAVVTYRNNNGTLFTTLYDKEGNMLYEPVKGMEYVDETPVELRKRGYLILDDGETTKLVDISGNIVMNFEDDIMGNNFVFMNNKIVQFRRDAKELIIHDVVDYEKKMEKKDNSVISIEKEIEITEQSICNAILEASIFSWNWFWESSEEIVDKSDTYIDMVGMDDNINYKRVKYENIQNINDVLELTKHYFTEDIAKGLIENKLWHEMDGKLYMSEPDGLGGITADYYDITIHKDSDTQYTITVYEYWDGELIEEPYEIHYMLVDGYWVFDEFLSPLDKEIIINVIDK